MSHPQSLHVASHGKLMISGEYAVLHGARALAVPVRFRQHLYVEPMEGDNIHWESYLPDGSLWMKADYSLDLTRQTAGKRTSDSRLIMQLLSVVRSLQPHLFRRGHFLKTVLEFSPQWGMGTSSSLVANLAKWAQVNPFEILDRSFGGSGYDVAVSTGGRHVLFEIRNGKRMWTFTEWNPAFAGDIFFVHLNRPQSTAKVLKKYKNLRFKQEQIQQISRLTEQMRQAPDASTFSHLISEHEKLLSKILKRPTVKDSLFPGFRGAIKSLGAWGGDMMMAVGDKHTPAYFRDKGYPVIFPFQELIQPVR